MGTLRLFPDDPSEMGGCDTYFKYGLDPYQKRDWNGEDEAVIRVSQPGPYICARTHARSEENGGIDKFRVEIEKHQKKRELYDEYISRREYDKV